MERVILFVFRLLVCVIDWLVVLFAGEWGWFALLCFAFLVCCGGCLFCFVLICFVCLFGLFCIVLFCIVLFCFALPSEL